MGKQIEEYPEKGGFIGSVIYCSECPVRDYCRRQTAATCPLVKIVER